MEEIKINGKALYTPKGAAMEYGRVGCNFYTGCPHECEYCYLKRGVPAKTLGGNVVQLKKCFKDEADALETFKKDVGKNKDILKKTGVFFSLTTDPMIKETRGLTFSAINHCIYNGIPVTILTKDASFMEDKRLILNLPSETFRKYVSIGFTLTGRDDMEPKASGNFERIMAMTELHRQGVRTWASIEPVIDWQHTLQVVLMSLPCCDHYKIGLRSGVGKDYYDVLRSGLFIDELTTVITGSCSTVYLKESARRLLRRCYKGPYYDMIMSRTVDMDGNWIKKENHG